MPSSPGRPTFFDHPSRRDESDGDLTAGDRRSYVSELRRADREQSEQAKQQLRDEGVDPDTLLPLERSGGGVSPATDRALRRYLDKTSRSSVGGTVAGGALGALAYFVGVAFLRGGWPGVKGWFAAKWLNKPPPIPAGAVKAKVA